MIYVPDSAKNILVNHSSGMDSTLLIYKLLNELKISRKLDKVNIFINTGDEPVCDPHASFRSDNICKKLFDKFSSSYTRLKFIYTDGETKIPTFKNKTIEYKRQYNIDVFYRGITLSPPKEIQTKYNYYKPERDVNQLTHIALVGESYTICPWYNVDKKFIVSEYKKDSFLMNEIYPLTHSCVCSGDKTENWTKHCSETQGPNVKNWCWWCVEKQWALGVLND